MPSCIRFLKCFTSSNHPAYAQETINASLPQGKKTKKNLTEDWKRTTETGTRCAFLGVTRHTDAFCSPLKKSVSHSTFPIERADGAYVLLRIRFMRLCKAAHDHFMLTSGIYMRIHDHLFQFQAQLNPASRSLVVQSISKISFCSKSQRAPSSLEGIMFI